MGRGNASLSSQSPQAGNVVVYHVGLTDVQRTPGDIRVRATLQYQLADAVQISSQRHLLNRDDPCPAFKQLDYGLCSVGSEASRQKESQAVDTRDDVFWQLVHRASP